MATAITLGTTTLSLAQSGNWASTGALATARAHHVASALPNGDVLVAGGWNSSMTGILASAERFDLATATWAPLAPMRQARVYATATRLENGRILVVGGQADGNSYPTAEVYDPAANTWTFTASMPANYMGHAASRLNDGRVLVAGGSTTDGQDHSYAAIYDPATNAWQTTGSMATGRGGSSAVTLIDGRVLVIGGVRGSNGGYAPVSTCETWNPATGTWSAAGTMVTGRGNVAASRLGDGRVLITGGALPGHYVATATAELFHPTTNMLSVTGSMAGARTAHTSVLLSDGRVLVAGGWGGWNAATNRPYTLGTAEIYDPILGSFASVTPLARERYSHTATALGDGRVLVTGGFTTSPTSSGLATCEIFTLGAVVDADAGIDFAVNEMQTVALDGSRSSTSANAALSYAWVQLPGGTAVTLSGNTTASPSFTAPIVALGGETLTFELTVTANGHSATDTVSVTIVNVNHPPVAEAGTDQSVAEGSPVTLHGEGSFDIDNDAFSYSWVQVGGSPSVTLIGTDTANPTFLAPYVAGGPVHGVVATLVFELRVDDGFPLDAPAPGYDFWNVADCVRVEITDTNNVPTATAGADQTVDENSAVALSGTGSSDPDSDVLTHTWAQVANGSPTVTLSGSSTATPTFTAPFVGAGGLDLMFELTVADGYGGSATDRVVVHVQNSNDPPLAAAARPTVAMLWPPNHQMVSVGITGVTDSENNGTIVITGVTQDEPASGTGDGDTATDAIIANSTVLLRAERSGSGDGRVYYIYFTASDLEGSTAGVVMVSVPKSIKSVAVDGGPLYVSTH